MEFFKKRSTAWRVLLIVMVFSYFIGMSKQPADKIEILPSGVYVQDNANILSDATEEYMTNESEYTHNFHESYSAHHNIP